MRYFFLLWCVCVLGGGRTFAQQHEWGLGGGFFLENSDRELDKVWMEGGELGLYYQYTPMKWIGLQTGCFYRYVSKNTPFITPKGSILLPLRAIVFPGFHLNLFGGVYLDHLLKDFLEMGDYDRDTGTYSYFAIDRKPAWGYEIGGRWNMKHVRLVLSFRRCFSSFLNFEGPKDDPFDNRYAPVKPKSVHLSFEIPLGRYGKK